MSCLAGVYARTLLNTSDVSQSDLNIANKFRSNPLSWNGQFSPQLVQVLLSKYATPGSVLFDPFLGSGTILLEAGLVKIAASGAEINPAAVALAQTYRLINVPLALRRFHLNEVFQLLQRAFSSPVLLFRGSEQQAERPESLQSGLVELLPLAQDCLQYQLLEALIVLLDFYRPDLSSDQVFRTWARLSRLVTELPFSEQPVEVYHTDARQTLLADCSVDLVITSPPYINVFNYHQQYRASAEALNWDLLKVAKSEIGSNRKHRSNRFLTVIQYRLDMAQILGELARVCRPGARVILVVGRESMVHGTRFFNGEIVSEIAHRALGFDLALRQERVFTNRYGQSIFEDILHFRPSATGTMGASLLTLARDVARDVLEAACSPAPADVEGDLGLALASLDTVQPSPLFNRALSRKVTS